MCRHWSEMVFQRIDDGRLKVGWADWARIAELQCIVCTNAPRLTNAPVQTFTAAIVPVVSLPAYTVQPISQVVQQQTASSHPINPRGDYFLKVDGKPCHKWNWRGDCSFTGAYGSLPNRFIHNCAWCAFKYRCLLVHRTV